MATGFQEKPNFDIFHEALLCILTLSINLVLYIIRTTAGQHL